jgi:cytochrome P450
MNAVAEYGDVVQLPLLKIPLTPMEPKNRLYLINKPDLVRHICLTNTHKYRTHKQLVDKLKLTLQLGEGELLTSVGEEWVNRKRLLQPSFMGGQVAGLTDKAIGAVGTMVKRWQQLPDGTVLDLDQEMTRFVTNLFAALFISLDLEGEDAAFGEHWQRMLNGLSRRMATPFQFLLKIPSKQNRDFDESWQAVEDKLYQLISAHRAGDTPFNDFLATWLAALPAKSNGDLSDKALRDQVLLMLLAGRKNVSNALVWSCHLLAKHPEVARKLSGEVDAIVQGELPQPDDLKKLPYLEMVRQEVLRLYPTAWLIARLCIEDDEVGGYHIPKGATVFMSPYTLHRHPSYWDDPETFEPERFSEERIKQITPDIYLPFGIGARTCIGNHLSKLIMQVVLAALSKNFVLEPKPDHQARIKATSSLYPAGGLPVILRKRVTTQAGGQINQELAGIEGREAEGKNEIEKSPHLPVPAQNPDHVRLPE